MDRNTFFKDHIGQTTPYPFLLDIDRAEGLYIWTKDGKKYIDMIAGVSVSNIGHSHPKVTNAIKEQVNRHMHVMVYGEYIQDSQINLTQELLTILPKSINSVYYVNSGTEANEAALKLAKRYTGRGEIVSFRNAYHGSTHGSLSVSGNETKKHIFRPLLPGVKFIRFNEMPDLDQITQQTACVIIEPVQGDAGVRIPDIRYMKALRDRCSEVGALLIVDEIQTGFGRTGKLFGFEHFNIIPDIITMAKGLGGGMPIGAFAANKAVMETLTFDPPLGHITTFGGHPVCCAAACENVKVIRNLDMSDVEEKGLWLEKALQHRLVKEIRRIGMFFAIEMISPEIVQQVVERCMSKGLIGFWFLSCPNAFRIAPPLNISWEELKESQKVIAEAMDQVANTDQ